jgi:putative spermidine/putrescine transport system permease protein
VRVRWHLLMLPSLILSLFLLVASQASFLRGSFFKDLRLGRIGTDLTFTNYAALFSDPFYLNAMWLTVQLSAIVTVLTLVGGFPLAYMLARMRSRWSLVLLSGVVVTSFITIVIKVLGLVIIFSANGMLNKTIMSLGLSSEPIGIMGKSSGVVIGLIHFTMGFAVMLLYGVLRTIPRSLEEAAQIHGSNRLRVFTRVIIPLALPGIIVTSLIVFNLCMGAFTSAALIGGGKIYTLPVLIQQTVILETRYAMAAAISAVLLAVTLLINLVSVLLVGRLKAARRVTA